ncbi:MAG: family 43 glycosylhydrolase [Tepidisphaeraceae bacterium]
MANAPEGPFHSLDGKDINPKTGWKQFPISVGHPIDAEIFKDDDGSYYMTWSQRFIAKMNADFTGFDGEPVPIRTKRGGYSEGPCMFKRNGIYYYLYTLGGSEGYQYAYMMSRTSPLGPWESPRNDIIATTNHERGVYGPGHGCFFKPSDSQQWYFIYLEYGRSGTNRQVMADKMNFNDDGTIQPIELTAEGIGAIRSDPEYAKPNLALGKHATASSRRRDLVIPPTNDSRLNRIESFGPDNALDDSNSSRWMAAEDDKQPSITVDLGEARDITRTELYFVKPTSGHAYRIDLSLDGVTWQLYGQCESRRVQSPHRDTGPAKARYVRVHILEGEAGLWQMRVY